ncbi:MAG: PAS domain-containing protein [Candidatus Sericytochromatia bacterium]
MKQEVFIRQNAENELSLERDNLRYLLKNIPDAVLTINAQGEIKLINNSFEKILNKQENEIINRNINDILFLYDNENNRILYKNFVDSKMYTIIVY